MLWTCWTETHSDRYPVQLTSEGATPPTIANSYHEESGVVLDSRTMHAAITFKADTEDDARRLFNQYRANGIPPSQYHSVEIVSAGKSVWRHRGAPHYLAVKGRELGFPDVLIHRAKKSPELRDLDRTVGELSRNYHETRTRQAGSLEFSEPERTKARRLLEHIEETVQVTTMIAAAAAQIIDDGWRAYGMEPPQRNYRVTVGLPPSTTETETKPDEQKPTPNTGTTPNPKRHQNAGVK